MQRRGASAELAAGLAVVLLAGIVLWRAGEIPVSPLYAQVGPKLVPYLVGSGMLLLGLALSGLALAGIWRAPTDDAGPIDLRALAWLAAGMALNAALIGPLGFIVASTAMFACVARGFGSRRWPRDLAIGFAISVVAYICFDRLLGIDINAGILEFAL